MQMRASGVAVGLIALATLSLPATAGAAGSPPTPRLQRAPALSLHASTTHARSHLPLRLTGNLHGAPPGTAVRVYASPYPYRHDVLIALLVPGPTGSFTTTAHPVRNTRFRATAAVASHSVSAVVQVRVADRTDVRVQALTGGRALIEILIYHPRDLRWNGFTARWRVLSAGRQFASSTLTRRLSPYVTILGTVLTLPAGRFGWRVCFYAPADQALDDLTRPATCLGRGYSGAGWLPNGFPWPRRVAAAGAFLARRAGRTAFAVIDDEGRLSGVNVHSTFVSASVVKAMLLVAYLRRLDHEGQHDVDSASNGFLYPMINVSDNAAATHCWSIVGQSGLDDVAGAAGMTDFSVYGFWANAQISAADQARFFDDMDDLIPTEFVGYARRLLSGIAAYESWGIPAIARPRGYTVFFKGGWRTTGLGQLVHQVARVESRGHTFALAVMTDGDPSMGYGIDTIQGVTQALVG
ncbi:MAG: hypothetical protein QOG59_2181 [Solirubrobacteraceae bacterium]|jgi:hypothetical protein|nr:hypothetical protein [Solirubrobacteraceae bacterium]